MLKIIVSPKKEACSDAIDAMVRRIAERFDPDQIIFFGSRDAPELRVTTVMLTC